MGNAGFIINKDNVLSNVNLIVPEGNYKIENLFAKIKRFNRIHVRRDKLIVSFMGFVHKIIIMN